MAQGQGVVYNNKVMQSVYFPMKYVNTKNYRQKWLINETDVYHREERKWKSCITYRLQNIFQNFEKVLCKAESLPINIWWMFFRKLS